MCALAGRGASDLEDLVQVAAEQVFRSLPSFSGRSDLSTWIYAICYRVLLRHRRWYRRWRLHFSVEEGDQESAASEHTPASALLEAERVRLLRSALAQLSDKYRAVVVLHDLEEVSVRDIARIVETGELTVRSRLRDGRKQLQRILQDSDRQGALGGQRELTSI